MKWWWNEPNFGSSSILKLLYVARRSLNKTRGAKKVQKNFLIGFKIWWSWGSGFFFKIQIGRTIYGYPTKSFQIALCWAAEPHWAAPPPGQLGRRSRSDLLPSWFWNEMMMMIMMMKRSKFWVFDFFETARSCRKVFNLKQEGVGGGEKVQRKFLYGFKK